MPEDRYATYRLAAERAAVRAGEVLSSLFRRVKAWEKGPFDLLTEADLASQRLITEALLGEFPRHTMMAEEEGVVPDPGNPWRWIVDPLDGTVNYAHGLPLWCVSIALEHEGELVVGIVHAPLLHTTHSASVGHGTTLNEQRVSVSQVRSLSSSLISTGMPADLGSEADRLMACMKRFSVGTHSVRRTGSSAWNLAMVASGGLELYYGTAMNPWDSAAGAVLVREAGGSISGLQGQAFDVYNPGIVASNGHVHVEAVKILQEIWPPQP